MSAGRWSLFAGLPTLGVSAYFLAAGLVPPNLPHLIFWELGVVELGTAALLGVAGGLALVLSCRLNGGAPAYARILLALFGLGAIVAALEEVSYGQHLFGWQPTDWFAQHNTQHETNLHNLFNDGSRRVLHQVGGNGCLLLGLILPAWAMMRAMMRAMIRGPYRPGHWTYYLLPRAELMPIVALELLVRLFKRLAGTVFAESWKFGLDEFRECLWAATALLYVIVLWQRLLPARPRLVLHVGSDSRGSPQPGYKLRAAA